MTDQADWDRFCDEAATTLRQALGGKLSLKEASDFFEQNKIVKDKDLRRYFESMVWEIDSTRDYYIELIQLFETHASEETFVRYLNSK